MMTGAEVDRMLVEAGIPPEDSRGVIAAKLKAHPRPNAMAMARGFISEIQPIRRTASATRTSADVPPAAVELAKKHGLGPEWYGAIAAAIEEGRQKARAEAVATRPREQGKEEREALFNSAMRKLRAIWSAIDSGRPLVAAAAQPVPDLQQPKPAPDTLFADALALLRKMPA